ncbi:hemicentin-2-like [Galleria mellonella]|uniref:Hemicentin-2-like n=1 Tax=Galleria mellonella TaxID=7137 RepID=A0A6J3BWH6_GALME|nr:hemicentin-2-like [Galleria mellonella]XP_052752264.1 hemicentin-2-like [Galleria mellonella]XP_052752265.1 hemicentin-2-like [Galleria mellonella]XP_052752266.1 hemicentin-2-like [Galleria mellonella]XP_052752267.1 hemicentin-2-like [Galleria mellonella]
MWFAALVYFSAHLGMSAGGGGTSGDTIGGVNLASGGTATPSELTFMTDINATVSSENMGQPYFDNATKRDYTAAVGQPAYLHCRVKNLADRAVSWIRKRDLHILTVGVHTYSSDARFAALHTDGSDEWTLRVAPAQPRDSGGYECQVSTEPKISLSFRLTVVVSKAEILSGPELFVRAGSDINLTCIARHAPDPPSFIYWYRGAHVVNYAQRGGISVETEQRTRTSRLLIARASPRDSGNYTCAPSSSDSASVVVHVVSGERPAAMQSNAIQVTPSLPSMIILLVNLNQSRSVLSNTIECTFRLTEKILIYFVIAINFLWPNRVRRFITR